MPDLKSHINDPEYWRERAAEARNMSEQMADLTASRTMLDIAKSYDYLAERAENRAKARK
jgi:hypothetical protein